MKVKNWSFIEKKNSENRKKHVSAWQMFLLDATAYNSFSDRKIQRVANTVLYAGF